MLESESKKIGAVAVLGCGAVVEKFYLPADKMAGADQRIKFVADLKDYDFPAFLNGKKYLKLGYREALDQINEYKCKPESVYIALPNWMHVDASILALGKGFNVLCEKPMALNIADCDLLEKAIITSGKKFAVGMTRRFLPDIQVLKRLIDNKAFGEILSVEVEHGSYYSWYSKTGTYFDRRSHGGLADLGVHYLDMLQYLIGDLEPIEYYDDCKGGIESHFEFYLKKDSIGIRITSSRKYKLKNSIKIVGSLGQGIVYIDENRGVEFKAINNPDIVSRVFPDDFDNTIDPLLLAFRKQFNAFDDCINGKRSEVALFEDGRKVTKLLEWAYSNRRILPIFDLQSQIYKNNRSEVENLGDTNSKVLITGGSGFIGGKLVNRLSLNTNNHLTVPVRSFMTIVELSNYNVHAPLIKSYDYQTCLDLTNEKNIVFHLAYGKSSKEANEVTINGTKNLLRAAAKNNVKSVVVLSTYSVFGRPNGDISVNESFPYKPNLGFYGKSKAVMEKWVLDFAIKNPQMNIVVLNPTCVWGPDSGTYINLPLHLIAENKFCLIDGENSIGNLVFIENLIDAMILVSKNKTCSGNRYIVNDVAVPWSKFFEALLGDKISDVQNYSLDYFDKLTVPGRTGLIDIARALVASDQLRLVLKNNPILSPILKLFWSDGYTKVVNANKALANFSKNCHPPRWLLDLFPVSQSRFSSEMLKSQTGWVPRYSFESGMEITKKWIESTRMAV